jgi:NAD(P)H dehydrogenase (quinone)
MKIYLLLGHPDKETFNGQIAEMYYQTAINKGHEVRFQRLGEMTFDPILWKGYKVIQELEPDLKQAQENILWCNKWVIVFPLWWGAVPALLKGFIDRTLNAGFAYKYHDNDPFWDKLLKGRSAELISTCDAPRWWIWWQYRNSDLNSLKRATLKFCGISPVKSTRISRVRYLSKEERQNKIEEICDRIKTNVRGKGMLQTPDDTTKSHWSKFQKI